MIHPWLLALGAGLMSVPIIIHLLNKRKFKIVDWAAMEFLLDADRRNRRRIRLENLILLLLRCLAVFLLGLLVARPFLPRSISAGWIDVPRYERIVMLDDSLSMEVRSGNQSALDTAKHSVKELLASLVDNGADEMFTLFLASDPQNPLLNAKPVDTESRAEIEEILDGVTTTEAAVKLEDALGRLESHVSSGSETINHVIYIYSDMRRRDWEGEGKEGAKSAPADVVARLSKRSSGCYLVDVGGEDDSNLVIKTVRPDGPLVAERTTRFAVQVANLGSKDVEDVRVGFYVAGSLPQYKNVELIKAGAEATVDFTQTFSPQQADLFVDEQRGSLAKPVRITARVESGEQTDRLEIDNERYLAARVLPGIPVLIVDGDPSAFRMASESYFLETALLPPGPGRSGVVTRVIVDTELAGISLDKYQLVFLCNVFRLSEGDVAKLERFVRAGNGLVIFPGDQVDRDAFNRAFYNEGKAALMIEFFDTNDDEQLSVAEFTDRTRFDRLDRDSDGELRNDEMTAWMSVFDDNHDGGVSSEELISEARFAKLDSDADQSLSLAELNDWTTKHALSPIKLVDYGGGESDEIWASFLFQTENHPVFHFFEGQGNAFFKNVHVFRFWRAFVDPRHLEETVSISAKFVLDREALPRDDPISASDFEIDESGSPAVVEKRFGNGRVMALTIPADVGWTNFGNTPDEFVTFVQLVVDYMAPNTADTGDMAVGNELVHQIDLADYEQDATLVLAHRDEESDGDVEKVRVQAVHEAEGQNERKRLRQIKYPDVGHRGFYELELTPAGTENPDEPEQKNTAKDMILFAANIDPGEGDLKRANISALTDSFADTNVKVIAGIDVSEQEIEGSKTEIWKFVLIAIAVVLCAEQFLGWLFGRHR